MPKRIRPAIDYLTPNQDGVKRADCHPEMRHYSKGLCKPCYQKEFKSNNPKLMEKYAKRRKGEKARWYNIKSKYGMTEEDYNNMLNEQGGVCKVCGSSDPKNNGHSSLSIDHCHETGKVRGLLCHSCNVVVGMAENNPKVLLLAADYLKKIHDNP